MKLFPALILILLITVPARATELVADLSKHLVAISARFTGTDVLLFGSKSGDGDIIVTVKGPDEDITVFRKERKAGIWVNGASAKFNSAPSYYATASSRPMDEFANAGLLARHQIGVENLRLDPVLDVDDPDGFRDALVRNKTQQGLYHLRSANVTFLGDQLFRTDLTFPANVPTGTYLVGVYLVRDNHVVSAEITPLIISKTGTSAEIFYFAHHYSALYGIAAILVAIAAGWLASAIFRKG